MCYVITSGPMLEILRVDTLQGGKGAQFLLTNDYMDIEFRSFEC